MNNQPTCACAKPRSWPPTPGPNSCGECGSPGASLKTWWRRWAATHPLSEPSIANEPIVASTIFSQRFGYEAAMREEAVVSDADTEAGDDEEHAADDDVAEVDDVAPHHAAG